MEGLLILLNEITYQRLGSILNAKSTAVENVKRFKTCTVEQLFSDIVVREIV